MFKNKQMDLRQVKCSQLYWADVLKIVERPTCYYKWESEYYYATFDWELINVIPYESTADTYLQSLQFRIIHRYFPCRYNLHLWNIVGDNKCEFCNDADTLSHYFAECDSVVQFWKFLKRWFIRTFQFVINFTSLDILLGIPNYDNSNDVMILNFVILFVKYYIYNCKKNAMPIDFFSFLVKLKSHLIIEEYRHIMYNRGLEFATKWSILSDSLWMY